MANFGYIVSYGVDLLQNGSNIVLEISGKKVYKRKDKVEARVLYLVVGIDEPTFWVAATENNEIDNHELSTVTISSLTSNASSCSPVVLNSLKRSYTSILQLSSKKRQAKDFWKQFINSKGIRSRSA